MKTTFNAREPQKVEDLIEDSDKSSDSEIELVKINSSK